MPTIVGNGIQFAILIVLALTLYAILKQLRLYNKLFNAQVLRDRFDMYWKTYDPISDSRINEFELIPDGYINLEKYDNYYKGRKDAIHKYLIYLQLYEYLAFAHKLDEMGITDPLGHATKKWTRDLIKENEFIDVHDYNKRFYPEFAKLVEGYRPK